MSDQLPTLDPPVHTTHRAPLGVPEEERSAFRTGLQRPKAHEPGIGSTSGQAVEHTPLEFLYGQFTA